jgi:hypothetical protein
MKLAAGNSVDFLGIYVLKENISAETKQGVL